MIHDFELLPNRRPKVLMCTCGHIAGAAYYYRPDVFEGDDENCYCNDDIIKCRRPSQVYFLINSKLWLELAHTWLKMAENCTKINYFEEKWKFLGLFVKNGNFG